MTKREAEAILAAAWALTMEAQAYHDPSDSNAVRKARELWRHAGNLERYVKRERSRQATKRPRPPSP